MHWTSPTPGAEAMIYAPADGTDPTVSTSIAQQNAADDPLISTSTNSALQAIHTPATGTIRRLDFEASPEIPDDRQLSNVQWPPP